MLANALAVLLGISSFIFYIAAFFYPEVHRRSDFLWSGLGMFYAVVLWFCAGQMTPSVMLGQVAAVTLLLGLGWQTLSIRREKTPVYQQTPVVLTPEVVGGWAKATLNQLRIVPDETIRPELQNRTLTAATSERLRQSLDPRRRPTYDYEFVEDGIWETDVSASAEDLEALAVEVAYTAPPSVAAEVVQEIVPEILPEPEVLPEPEILPEIALKVAVESAPETAPEIEPQAELDLEIESAPEADVAVSNVQDMDDIALELEVEAAVETPIDMPVETPVEMPIKSAKNDADDDWGEDFSDLLEPEPQASAPLSLPEKPSLIKAPLILAAWAKDVVASMTQPKPSKPVIEIPRREAVVVSEKVAIEEESPVLETFDDEPPKPKEQDFAAAGDFAEEPSAEEPNVEDDWEESNWDD